MLGSIFPGCHQFMATDDTASHVEGDGVVVSGLCEQHSLWKGAAVS